MSDFDMDNDVLPRYTVESVIVRVGEGPNHHWPVTLLLENGEGVILHASVTNSMVGLVDDAHLHGAQFAASPEPYYPPHPTIPALPDSLSEFVIGGRRFIGVAARNAADAITVKVRG